MLCAAVAVAKILVKIMLKCSKECLIDIEQVGIRFEFFHRRNTLILWMIGSLWSSMGHLVYRSTCSSLIPRTLSVASTDNVSVCSSPRSRVVSEKLVAYIRGACHI